MNTNSINSNGCSVCETGKENYTTFRPANRPKQTFYQYDYRHIDKDLFSTIAKTLEECRLRRDTWLQQKNYKKMFPSTIKAIENGKRLTKCDMGYQIGHVEAYHPASIYWDKMDRDYMVKAFNKVFGTNII